MSPQAARTSANLLMAAAVGAAAYVVLRTPSLRQNAWRAIRMGMTVTLPGYLLREVTQAWAASEARP